MFRQLEPSNTHVTIVLSGRRIEVPENANLASALLEAGVQLVRKTPVSSAPRLPYCMMGACFDCLINIDGIPNRQACLETVRDGMIVEVQDGNAHIIQNTSSGECK